MKFKTKADFIKSVMAGDVWECMGSKLFYDGNEDNPFRYAGVEMKDMWESITSANLILVKPEPIIERRWRMLKDTNNGETVSTDSYCNQEIIEEDWDGWYKHPTDYIDVEVK